MMPILDFVNQIGNNAKNSFLGENNKAIIEIEDERPAKGSTVNVTETAARSAGSVLGSVSNIVSQASAAVGEASGLSEALKQMAQNGASMGGQSKFKRFEVKFNPNQLRFRAQGGMKVEKKDFSDVGDGQTVQVKYEDMHPRIEMNVQLIFDDCERTDAFQFEKFGDGMAMIRTAVDSGVMEAKDTVHSVKYQVEGFIGAMRNEKTRRIRFFWGGMMYQGVLNSLNAEYTMFSTTGHPIRATVDLGIVCTDETLGDNNMGQWQASFQKAFGTGDGTNLESAMQNVGNLLNINL